MVGAIYFAGWRLMAILIWPCAAWTQENSALQKIAAGAKKEGKVKLGLTVRWEEGGKPAGLRRLERVQPDDQRDRAGHSPAIIV